MSSCDESSINKNYIVQTPTDTDILSACTGFYTNNIYNCTGDTLTLHSNTVSANTINSTVYLSGGTNLLDIFGSLDNYTTGATLIGSTAYFDRSDTLSAYTLDLSSLDVNDTFVSGGTYNEGTTSIDFSGNSVETTFSVSLSGISSNIDIYNTYFVSPTGDDSTAVRGDLHNPFKTITAARNKVVAELSASTVTGDTLIHVYPGIYTEDEIQYENGNFYFEPGATINQPNRGGSLIAIFNLGDANTIQPNTYTADTCNIYGHVDINLGGGSLSIAHFMRGDSESIFEFNKINIGNGFGLVPWENSKLFAKGVEIDGQTGQYCFRAQGNSESILNIKKVTAPSVGFGLHWRIFNGLSYVNVGEVITPNSQIGLFTQQVGVGSDIVVDYGIVRHVDSGSTYVINNFLQSGGKITYRGNISSKGNGGAVYNNQSTGGEINIIGDIKTDSTAIQLTSSNTTGNTLNYVGNITTTNPNTSIDLDDGSVRLDGSLNGMGGTTNGIDVSSGVNLSVSNFSIENVSGDSVTGTGSIEILNNLYIDKPLTVPTTGQYTFTGTTYDGDLNIYNTPTNDNTLTQILGRNATTGDVEYRDVESIISAATSQDTFVTGYTYDNANTFTISDNSGNTFNATINTVTGLTVNGDLSATTVSACTGIYTSNLYGCSPVTVHDNLQHITSSATGINSIAWGTGTTASGNYSHAEGYKTTASGNRSHAEGRETTASGLESHAEGWDTTASGGHSHAEGRNSTSIGSGSHAEGISTTASGSFSHAEGNNTTASGLESHAEGYNTTASGQDSHAEGKYSTASGYASHAEGLSTTSSNYMTHAEGYNTTSSGYYSHAEGFLTTASGGGSHTEGKQTTASGEGSHAEGLSTTASGNYSHAEGLSTTSIGGGSHAEGSGTTASGKYSHSEGQGTIAGTGHTGYYTGYISGSHAEGVRTVAIGGGSHAEGVETTATTWTYYGYVFGGSHAEGFRTTSSGGYSHAEGGGTTASGNYSHAEGYNTTSSGGGSHAEGLQTTSSGGYSHAEGRQTTASGVQSHAEGSNTTASGGGSHAEGLQTTSSGDNSHAEGRNTTASGDNSHAEGRNTTSIGVNSHAEGRNTTSIGVNSHAEGRDTTASGKYSHAEGKDTTASGDTSHAEGRNTTASGYYSHAEGSGTQSSAYGSHAEGGYTIASGHHSHAEGVFTTASGTNSHAEGSNTTASGPSSHAEGVFTTASGNRSHAEGKDTTASGGYSHAEGRNTTSSGTNSHAEGGGTTASGNYSHAEGRNTTSSGGNSHAEGFDSASSGESSHAEGSETTASGTNSHAEGFRTISSGQESHAEGRETTASGISSHAEGRDTTASGISSHAGGRGVSGGNIIVASGDTSFVHFRQTTSSGNIGAYGDYSVIIGGNDHNIGTGSTSSGIFAGSGNTISDDVLRTVVLGGGNITGTTDDTVYVPYLNINNIDNDDSLTQILSRDNSDGSIKYRDVSSISTDDFYVSGGTYNSSSKEINFTGNSAQTTFDVDLTTLFSSVSGDTFIVSGNADAGNSELTFTYNTGGTITVTNSAALFSDNDINVTGGTYNPSNGCVTFGTNSGTTFDVCGFVTGITDTFTTGSTLVGETIQFDNNILGLNYYNVSLSPVLSGKTNNSTFNTYTSDTQTVLNSKVSNGINSGGGSEIFSGKSGSDLYFRTLSGGSNTTLTTVGDVVKIDVAVPSGDNFFSTAGTVTQSATTGSTEISLQIVGTSGFTPYTITGLTDTFVNDFTFSSNTFTITQNDGSSFDSSVETIELGNILSAVTFDIGTSGSISATTFNGDTFSGGTFYGDGSNLTGITSNDTFVTGFTYDNSNNLTISRNDGTGFTTNISTMSGLTIDGTLIVDSLSATTYTGLTLNSLNDVTTNIPTTPDATYQGELLYFDTVTNQWVSGEEYGNLGDVTIWGKKGSAGTIDKGLPVYIVGFDSDIHEVELANATTATTMPVIGFTAEDFDNSGVYPIVTFGKVTGVDTTSTVSTINPNGETWTVNDVLFMNTTDGGLTKNRPSGSNTQIQRVAKILKVGTNDGQIFIFNTARTAGLPNLTTDYLWVGNGNDTPQEVVKTDVGITTTGFTYNNGNTLTLTDDNGGSLSTTINTMSGLTVNGTLSATTISGGTLFGDGSNLTGISSESTTITGFTYNNANTFTISDSSGTTFDASINIMTGLTVNGESVFSGTSTDVLQIYGSGTTTPIFRVEGSAGELFSISDGLIGDLFTVNNISGLPILVVNSDNTILWGDNTVPSLNTTVKKSINSGLTEIYSVPVSAYTGGFFEYTVTGTGARAGSIMSIFSGTSIDFNETSTNDIGDTSGITFDMNISGGTANLTVSATTNSWEIRTIVRSI